MRPGRRPLKVLFLCAWVVFLPFSAHAQKKLACPDGQRYEIDLRQIAIRYEASDLSATLSGLSVLRSRLTVEPRTLQTAALATQEWNEFLKGLVAGYNSCAITKGQ